MNEVAICDAMHNNSFPLLFFSSGNTQFAPEEIHIKGEPSSPSSETDEVGLYVWSDRFATKRSSI